MNPPFAIGDEIVRIEHDSDGIIKKGQKFKVLDLWYCCKKWGWRVDIGVFSPNTQCECGKVSYRNNYWACKNFRKIERTHDDATSEILEKFKQTDEKPDVIKIKELI